MSKAIRVVKSIARWLLYGLLALLLLFALLVLLIRLPRVQNRITGLITTEVSKRTGADLSISHLYLTFSGGLEVEKLFLGDTGGDTILYTNYLSSGIAVMPLLRGSYHVSHVNVEGLRLNLVRNPDSAFNYSFILDSLAGKPAETTAKPPPAEKKLPSLSSGPINLSDCRVNYTDSTIGLAFQTKVNELELLPGEIDLEEMRYDVTSLDLNGSTTSYLQFSAPPSLPDSSSAILPQISWGRIRIRESRFNYESQSSADLMGISLAEVKINSSLVNLPDSLIEAGEVSINGLSFLYASEGTDTSMTSGSTEAFSLPNWKLELAGLAINDSKLVYRAGQGTPETSATFNPSNLVVENLNLDLGSSTYSPEETSLKLRALSLLLNQSFVLDHLEMESELGEQHFALNEVRLNTPRTRLSSSLTAEFSSLSALMKEPIDFSSLKLNIPASTIGLKDLLFFQPTLDTNEIFTQLSAFPVQISGNIEGKVDDLDIDRFSLSILDNTELQVSGNVRGLPDTTNLSYKLPSLSLHTGVNDLSRFIDTSGMTLPAFADLNGSFYGNLSDLRSNLSLSTDLLDLEADLDLKAIRTSPSYEVFLKLSRADIAKLAGIADLEPVSAEFNFSGSGLEPAAMNARLTTAFEELIYRNYNYKRLELDAEVRKGSLAVNLVHQSQELAMNAKLSGQLDTALANLALELRLKGAKLQDLGLSDNNYKVGFDLKADLDNRGETLSVSSQIQKLLLISGSESYRLDSLYFLANNSPDTSRFLVHSDLLKSRLTANCNLEDLVNNISYYSGYKPDTLNFIIEDHQDFSMTASLDVLPHPFLTEVLLPELEGFDTIQFEADFSPGSDEISANLHTTGLTYGSRSIQNLRLNLNSGYEKGSLDLDFDEIRGPYISIGKTSLSAERKGSQGSGILNIFNKEDIQDYYLALDFENKPELKSLSIRNDSLVLNQLPWQIDPENSLQWGAEGVVTKNFRLYRDQEEMRLASSENMDELDISFREFDLNVLFGLLNSEQDLISGKLNGEIDVINLRRTPGFMADLSLDNFSLTETELGELKLTAESGDNARYDLDLKLEGPEINFAAKGYYNTNPQAEVIDLDLDLSFLKLKLLRDMFPDNLDSARGQISAHLDLEGALRNPDYNGELKFEDAGVLARQLGTYLQLRDEHIKLNNAGLTFDDFVIRDPEGHTLTLTGDIDTRNALNPAFDLSLQANNFQLINAKEGDYDLYYGQVLADLDIKLTGDRQLPVVRSEITLQDATDFTYIVPASQAQIESQRGIVVFENMEDTLDILQTEDNQARSIRGFDIQSRIILKKGTQLRMLLDPRSGDNMTITGAADLDYTLSPNGNMNLTGRYVLSDGGYKLNLYDLVKKEFNIRDGSQITWTGNPIGASLNITAVYSTKTSAASLMDDPDPRFNRSLPFEVLLYIKGTIDQPEISFGLDMPTDSRAAMGGDVYSKLKQVNDDESELNKQVFALIVFDRFIPSSESGDAGVSTADIARSSVSDFLSGQLNNLSQRYLKGVELDVNIESYTDYAQGGGQERTDLNLSLRKAFFDDRVVLEVGSNMALDGYQRSSDVVGDIALEYLLTEEGTYRIRGYRRNDYQSPVEGEVIITGMALIFSREFNNWGNLFKMPQTEDDPLEIAPKQPGEDAEKETGKDEEHE